MLMHKHGELMHIGRGSAQGVMKRKENTASSFESNEDSHSQAAASTSMDVCSQPAAPSLWGSLEVLVFCFFLNEKQQIIPKSFLGLQHLQLD